MSLLYVAYLMFDSSFAMFVDKVMVVKFANAPQATARQYRYDQFICTEPVSMPFNTDYSSY